MKKPFLLTYSVKKNDRYSNSETNSALIREKIYTFLSADTQRTECVIKHENVETTISGMIEVPSGNNSTKEKAVINTIQDAFSSLLKEHSIREYTVMIHCVIYAETLENPIEIFM
ncbi:hypothetical protein [Proteus terrae]|uniref:hypothetical protein n=1 Tax=Proteus terrae TaxID=1574161 RepID=UPI001F3FD2BD|nr:hypothetical protein [Proteus terrae]